MDLSICVTVKSRFRIDSDKEWHECMCSNFKCILESERMVVFDLYKEY